MGQGLSGCGGRVLHHLSLGLGGSWLSVSAL